MAHDRELWRWAPPGVTLYFTRTARVENGPADATVGTIESISKVRAVEDSVRCLLDTEAAAYAYACTSCSFVRGHVGERKLVEGMRDAGAPAAVTTSGALVEALRSLGVTRVAAATPYNDPLTALFASFLAEAGMTLAASTNLGLSSGIKNVSPETTMDLIRRADRPDAEAVCVSCTNLATYDVIAPLEQELGKPVVTANQATMWAAARLAGRHATGDGQWLLRATGGQHGNLAVDRRQ